MIVKLEDIGNFPKATVDFDCVECIEIVKHPQITWFGAVKGMNYHIRVITHNDTVGSFGLTEDTANETYNKLYDIWCKSKNQVETL